MPKVRLTADDRRKDTHDRVYQHAKTDYKLKDKDMAQLIGISLRSLCNKTKDPVHKFWLDEWLKFANAYYTDEQILSFVRGR